MKHLANYLKNRIWFIAAAVLFVLLAVQGCGRFYEPTMDLEQSVRCGREEHVHNEECYMDELLICGKRAHSHGENCYIFRVDENDINAILTDMGEKGIYSLEDYMAYTLSAVYGEGASLDDLLRYTSVEELNAVLSTTGVKALRFNAAADLPATYAVGDAVSTANYKANFYIYLDGAWTHIGTMDFTTPYNYYNSQYTRTISTADILEFINEAVEPNYSALSDNVRLYYGTSSTNYNNSASIGGTSTTFGSSRRESTARSAIYVRIISASGSNSGSNTDLKFYTVTLNYSQLGTGKATESQIVQSGKATSLTYDTTIYSWYTSPTSEKALTTAEVEAALSNVSGTTTLYAKWPPKNCTVTYKDNNGNPIKDSEQVASGSSVKLPDGYKWRDGTGKSYDGGASVTITGDTNFVGTPIYTVIFEPNNGLTIPSQRVESGDKATEPTPIPTLTGHAFQGWYLDGTKFTFNTPITGNITLTAKWTPISYTITYIDGTSSTEVTAAYGTEITLPEIANGTYWQLSGGGLYSPGDKVTVNGNMTFTSTDKVVATFVYKNGNVTTSNPVNPEVENNITLPTLTSGNVWMDEDGNVHQPGAKVTIRENTVFTEKYSLKVTYNVNFSSSGLTSNTPPTIIENGSSSATITIYEGQKTTLYSVDPRVYLSGTSSGEAAYFRGWVPATDGDAILPPGAALSYEVLSQYASNSVVNLSGSWHRDSSDNTTDVRFYVRFDSVPPDTSGNVGSHGTNYYTGQVYLAYAGNSPASNSGFTIADKTADNSYTADKTIRALVGNKGDGELWISGVPDDAWLFEQLKAYTYENVSYSDKSGNKYLRIYMGTDANGSPVYENVLADELDTDHYAMRWYVFKKEGDGWHIDGRLVKKQGQITIDKIFGGNHEAIEQVVGGFYILAENGYMENGSFVPYTTSNRNYNAYVLVREDVDQSTLNEIRAAYPNATLQYYNTEFDINGEITDHWLVEDVTLGEYWRFTEFVEQPTYEVAGSTRNYSWYAEYTITDTDGTQSAIAEFGSRAQVIGKTYALDEDADQGLDIEFTNYYYDSDSILIRKIDGDTGEPLGGAEFQLWQPVVQGGASVQLKFTETEEGIYSVDPTGTIGSIVTNNEGFSVITIQDFSYESGPLTVKEVTAPTGYAVVNDISLGYLDEEHTKAGIISIVGADASEFDYHAEYHDENGGVLVVKDHAASYTNVSVTKKWEGSMTADKVNLVLQATVDGKTQNAGGLFPNLNGHEVVLDAKGGYPATNGTPNYTSTTPWSYTWTNLPAYANGKPVAWSVKETKVGNEVTMVGSDQFANWIVTYSTSSEDNNDDGVADLWKNTVTNTQRRTMLYVYKTNMNGTVPLSDAKFRLVEVDWDAKTKSYYSKGVVMDHVTDETGYTAFDGLAAGTFYALTETEAPPGYILAAGETVISIDGMGVVYGVTEGVRDSVPLSTEYVSYTRNYVVNVKNTTTPELPATGGDGTDVYTRLGALLMLAAAAAVIYKAKRRREGDASAV